MKPLDFLKNCATLSDIGLGTPVSTAGIASVNGGDSQNIFFAVSLCFEPAGRTLCGATVDACSNPAGSFLYQTWNPGKRAAQKTLINRR
jgi:hypothetical protein